MSPRPAVFQGSYADLKFIRSRKVCQVVIELPLEAGAAFVDAFGTPNPAAEVPVALARINPTPEILPAPERRRFSDLAYAQQAALRCNEPEFQRFLAVKVGSGCNDAVRAAHIVRSVCQVQSRRELDSNADAGKRWTMLDAEFFGWQRDPRAA